MVPRAVLMKSGLVSINNARQNISKIAVSVNTVRQVNTAHSKTTVNAARPMHMIGNMPYLTEYEEIDRGYVAFGGNPKGGKITGKCTIKTVPRKNNMHSVDLKNIVPKTGLTCLFSKATSDESKIWHRRLGHFNFKIMNKLVKENLVRGLPSKLFENDQTYVACQKGKQHKASCKTKTENSISLPLHLLHMDLFGPTFVKSLMKKMYCLVVIDDYSRFTWIFFLATKDETNGILKYFITRIENLVDHKVKVIRCDNETEFKNKEMIQFYDMKGILRQFSVARTPQQNGVAERRNRILIEAARTMLADSKLPTTFWVEAVNTACYVQNRVLLVKPHNKTPYELFYGRTPTLSFTTPFGCHVTILNTIDHLGKFDGKADEGIQSNGFVTTDPPFSQDPKSSHDDGSKPSSDDEKKVDEVPRKDSKCKDQEKEDNVNSTNNVNAVSINKVNAVSGKTSIELPVDPNMLDLEDYSIFNLSRDDEDVGANAYMNNLDTTIQVSPIPTTRIHKDHPLNQVIGLQSATQTRKMSKNLKEHGKNPKSFVDDIIFGSTKKELCNAFEKLMHEKFQMSSIGELTFFLGLQVQHKKDGIFISQDKYVVEILKKFRSMIGSLMYLTSSRPDIMFAVCAYARYQVNPKVSHLHAVKRIFRLISWQCKKQTVVANSITEAEDVATSSCCGQVLWIQN
ncbi:putative ribonuclease H-like domain-containing protein [Tanacetum coccineum]